MSHGNVVRTSVDDCGCFGGGGAAHRGQLEVSGGLRPPDILLWQPHLDRIVDPACGVFTRGQRAIPPPPILARIVDPRCLTERRWPLPVISSAD